MPALRGLETALLSCLNPDKCESSHIRNYKNEMPDLSGVPLKRGAFSRSPGLPVSVETCLPARSRRAESNVQSLH